MKNGIGPKTMLVGLIVGTLSIPALVLAATTLAGPSDDVAAESTTSTTDAPVEETTPTTNPPTATAPDPAVALEAACGADGLSLVAAEADGSISALQQAALDALRPVCSEAGMALPMPPTPEPVVVVETVEASAPVATSVTTPASGHHEEDDDHDDHGDEDEDDDHGDEEDDDHDDEDEDD